MKNVLLIVHDDDGQESRVQAALDLTRALDGHLTCLDIVCIPELFHDYVSTAGGMMIEADEWNRSGANRRLLEPRIASEDVRWNWVQETGDITDIVGKRIDLSDIVVLNTNLDDQALSDMLQLTSDAVVKLHKPIVAMPEASRSFRPSGRSVVAWDGSASALAALRAATPLLQMASDITIIAIDRRDDGGIAPEDAAEYLSRHGAKANIQMRSTEGFRSVASALSSASTALNADYIVLGAYGHSRVTEAVFGGVTRTMLRESQIPLVLAH